MFIPLPRNARPGAESAPRRPRTALARGAAPLAVLLLLAGQTLSASPAGEQTAADLLPIKEYTLANAAAMRTATGALRAVAADYRELLARHDFDYQAAWQAQADDLHRLVNAGRDAWVEASTAYELSEGSSPECRPWRTTTCGSMPARPRPRTRPKPWTGP